MARTACEWIAAAALAISMFTIPAVGQTAASDFFPVPVSKVWMYHDIVLDSAQHASDSLLKGRTVIFAGDQSFEGKTAHILRTEYLRMGNIPTDTQRVSMSVSTAYAYLQKLPSNIGGSLIDSLSLVAVAQALRGWYPMYQFNAVVGAKPYTVFQKDTNLTVNGTSLPLRFAVTGSRLADQTVTVPAGTYTGAKRFVSTFSVSVMVLPFLPVEVFSLPETTFIAAGTWIVRESVPSKQLDLSAYGGGTTWIPGRVSELDHFEQIVNVPDRSAARLENQELRIEAWPNPFNPTTTIRMSAASAGHATLTVYDAAGREVDRLFDDKLEAGVREIRWDAERRASGTYFLRMIQADRSVAMSIRLLK